MLDCPDLIVSEEDFDDIEADFGLRQIDLGEVKEGGAGEASLAFEVNGVGGASPLADGAGFDFDEDEAIVVVADEVDFAVATAEVGGEEAES
jgi:hypothetical protein